MLIQRMAHEGFKFERIYIGAVHPIDQPLRRFEQLGTSLMRIVMSKTILLRQVSWKGVIRGIDRLLLKQILQQCFTTLREMTRVLEPMTAKSKPSQFCKYLTCFPPRLQKGKKNSCRFKIKISGSTFHMSHTISQQLRQWRYKHSPPKRFRTLSPPPPISSRRTK